MRRHLLAPPKGPVFVIGTGRSGTHFLGECLRKFDGIDDAFGGRESPLMFARIARRTVAGRRLGLLEMGYYGWMAARVRPRMLLDKTHPNIWHVEDLLRAFPSARFVGIRRDLPSVVASMLAHHGTSLWPASKWARRVPNPFLGVTARNVEAYRHRLTDLQRHVFRWCSHMERLAALERNLGDRVLVVEFLQLHVDMSGVMRRVASFLDEPVPNKLARFDPSALDRNDRLDDGQHRQIEEALRIWRELR